MFRRPVHGVDTVDVNVDVSCDVTGVDISVDRVDVTSVDNSVGGGVPRRPGGMCVVMCVLTGICLVCLGMVLVTVVCVLVGLFCGSGSRNPSRPVATPGLPTVVLCAGSAR